ncbi:hypothetical protein ACE3MS_15530 [Paenibacillus dendritiformis]|uniref:hypothetical protein n=1 Tax=Paenibacillus dendritiformis TaxID=130049 RepID=UPI0036549A96
MPEETPNLGLKKPLGNEVFNRASYNENLDIMDANVVSRNEFDTEIDKMLPKTGGEVGALTVKGPGKQLTLAEADGSETWHIESTGTMFKVVQTGHADRLVIPPMGSGNPTLDGHGIASAEVVEQHISDEQKHVSATDRQEWDGAAADISHAPAKEFTFTPGLQVVESEQDTPFRMGEIKGRTLINLIGRDGNFDYRSSRLFTFFGTGEIVPSSGPVGTKCQKIVCNRTDTAHFGARYELEIDRSKHYVAMTYMENVNCDVPVYFSLAEFKATGYISIEKSASLDKGSGMQYLYATITPAQMENREKLIYYFRGEGTSGAEFRIGPFAFYEITADEYDAIAKMTPEQVAARYPYVDSMTNVKNPYAIVTGGNLLPPFYDGWAYNVDNGSTFTATGPHVLTLDAKANNQQAYCNISVVSNTTYFIGLEQGKYAVVGTSEGTPIIVDWTSEAKTFNSGNETLLRVYLGNYQDGTGAFTFENPILTIGTEPKPFARQQCSTLGFETQLAAHPVDGSNPDTLFMGDDGLPYVNEMWGKVTLDGNMKYLLAHNGGDFRTFFTETLPPTVKDTAYITKYDGKMLVRRLLGQSITEGDTQVLTDSTDVNPNRSVFSVFNTDSGWGPDYKLTEDDIKAYFLGWKMYHVESNDYKSVYNGTGTKRWVSLADWSTLSPVGVTPSDMAPDYTPYRLQYLKAKPTVEPVRNYEMGATLSAGSNMVEVGSGIVIREKANPVGNYINAINAGGGLKYKTTNLLAIYRNQTRDFGWTFKDGIWDGEPYQYAENPIPAFANAIYHVTYTMLDPTLAAPISGTVAANLRGTVSDLVQEVGDVGQRLSVVENGKAEKDAKPPEWIKASLLNGWTDAGTNDRPVSYRVVGDTIEIDGTLRGNGVTTATTAFILPAGCRPFRNVNFVVSKSMTGGTNPYTRVFVAAASGEFRVVPENDTINDWVSLNGIRLYTT